jgi:2-keto-3-deoxy-L-rhamnonate aldolase RhmA
VDQGRDRMQPREILAEKLNRCRAVVGMLQAHTNLVVTELAGMCGYDFIVLDIEHGFYSDSDCQAALQVIAASQALAFVRLRDHNCQNVGRYLDMGFDGILAPNVTSASQAHALSNAMVYPPQGTRGAGAGLHRITNYGSTVAEHLADQRGGSLLIPMVESGIGVENVDQILAVDGVDGVLVGPGDLSASLGGLGNFENPAFASALARIETAAAAAGKLAAIAPPGGIPIEALVARGYSLLLVGFDAPLLREAMSLNIANARERIQQA